MTKLEEKLIELGYEPSCCFKHIYEKFFTDTLLIKINILDFNHSRVYVYGLGAFYTQQDIDNLQQAFNQLQNDLEVLKEYENAS